MKYNVGRLPKLSGVFFFYNSEFSTFEPVDNFEFSPCTQLKKH